MGDIGILLDILQQLRLDSTPPFAVHSDDPNNVVYVIYKLQVLGLYKGYPVLKVLSSSSAGISTDIITRGLLIDNPSINVAILDSNLRSGLLATVFG